MAQTNNDNNSGMGVVLGVFVAVLVIIGAYFAFNGNTTNGDYGHTTTTPDVNINTAPPATPNTPAP
jgi:hypothetical protein